MMTEPAFLIAATCSALIFLPLVGGLLVYLVPSPFMGNVIPIVLGIGLLASLGPLSHEALSAGATTLALGGHFAPLGIELRIDGLALAMLWLTAIVAVAINIHAATSVPESGNFRARGFRSLWLLLWSGLNALFLSADLFNIYVVLEITAITAISLVVISRGSEAVAAATRYLYFALVGSLFYLLGVALVYGKTGLLSLRMLEALSLDGPVALLALALMTFGLAMKAALFPVHAWLPRAHAIAPSPASAVLSALVAKAGAYLVLRIWLGPFDGHWPALAGQGMAALGTAGIVYGSVQALRQSRLKLIVAYSTVAQLGYLLLVFPLASILAWQGVIYHALSHGLAKAAFFLAAGNIIILVGSDRLASLQRGDRLLAGNIMVMALAGISLAGLPPSGGFLGKWWLISAAIESGQWWWAISVAVGGLLAAAYVFRILRYALAEMNSPETSVSTPAPGRLSLYLYLPPLILALAAIALGFAGQTLVPYLLIGLPGSLSG